MPADPVAFDPHPPLLEAEGVVRHYGATAALRGVDFVVRGGAVNVLIGENGAGKSTLMRILAGVEQPDAGRLRLNGDEVAFASVRDASRRGIGIVHQELNLCPNLTVTENIFLGRTRTRGMTIDRRAERSKAAELLARLGADEIDPDAAVATLRIGQQQIVEIARALAEEVRILIMDEPTSALSAAEVETLFGIMDELRRAGVGIVYISHKLEELLRIGDIVTVMRDGLVVASVPASEASVDWIVETMLGNTRALERRVGGHSAGDVVLAFDHVRVLRPDGAPLVDDVSCEFRAGEIVGIYGLLGAGRTELFEYVTGLRGGHGAVRLAGERIDHLPIAHRIEKRLLLVPEDRQRDGLFANLRVGGNLSLSFLDRLLRYGAVSEPAEGQAVGGMIARLGIKARSGATPIGALSGGNQQKVVIGRCLLPGPLAMLLDEPGRGVDVGARAEVFDTMRALAAEGIAIVFATSDLAEALTIADRILVMANGRLTADLPAAMADEPILVRAANSTSRAGTAHAAAVAC